MVTERPAERTCVRPCCDCPFRKDGAAYQAAEALADNIRRTLVEFHPQHCHHSLMDASEGSWLFPHKAKPRLCAGHSIFLHKLGLRPLPPEVKDGFELVVDSIEEFVRLGSMHSRSAEDRHRVWLSLQPKHVRARWAAKIADSEASVP